MSSTLSNAGQSPTFTLKNFLLPPCLRRAVDDKTEGGHNETTCNTLRQQSHEISSKRMLELALDTSQTTIIWLIEVGLVTINLGNGFVNKIVILAAKQ